MNIGDVYIYANASTIYYLPNVTCSNGSTITVPNQVYYQVYLSNGRYVKGSRSTFNSTNSTQYICHVYDGYELLDPNTFVLPGTLIMLSLFAIIYRWFIRLRG